MDQICERLRYVREEAGIGLREMATRLQKHPSWLSRLENGNSQKVPDWLLTAYVHETGCSAHWLLTSEGSAFAAEGAA